MTTLSTESPRDYRARIVALSTLRIALDDYARALLDPALTGDYRTLTEDYLIDLRRAYARLGGRL